MTHRPCLDSVGLSEQMGRLAAFADDGLRGLSFQSQLSPGLVKFQRGSMARCKMRLIKGMSPNVTRKLIMKHVLAPGQGKVTKTETTIGSKR